jgi:hypothetical protein
MKIVRFALIAIVIFASVTSCTREDGLLKSYTPTKTDSTGNVAPSGGNTDSTYTGIVTNNYQPYSAGSSWTYQVTQVFNIANSSLVQLDPSAASLFASYGVDTTITYHVQALNDSTTLNGLVYHEFSNDYQGGVFAPSFTMASEVYTGVDMVWEILWVNGANFGGFSLNDDTLAYLWDQPTGTTWNRTTVLQDAFGYNDTTTYVFVIKGAGLTRTVNNTVYPSVIQVESTALPSSFVSFASLFASEGYNIYTTTDYYYAKNVGLVEEDLSEPLMGITLKAILLNASIK